MYTMQKGVEWCHYFPSLLSQLSDSQIMAIVQHLPLVQVYSEYDIRHNHPQNKTPKQQNPQTMKMLVKLKSITELTSSVIWFRPRGF